MFDDRGHEVLARLLIVEAGMDFGLGNFNMVIYILHQSFRNEAHHGPQCWGVSEDGEKSQSFCVSEDEAGPFMKRPIIQTVKRFTKDKVSHDVESEETEPVGDIHTDAFVMGTWRRGFRSKSVDE